MEGASQVQMYGILAKMLLNIYPEIHRYKFVIEQGKKVISTVLKYALYLEPIISILIWRDLVVKLKPRGFQKNPYYPCAMNKFVGETL